MILPTPPTFPGVVLVRTLSWRTPLRRNANYRWLLPRRTRQERPAKDGPRPDGDLPGFEPLKLPTQMGTYELKI